MRPSAENEQTKPLRTHFKIMGLIILKGNCYWNIWIQVYFEKLRFFQLLYEFGRLLTKIAIETLMGNIRIGSNRFFGKGIRSTKLRISATLFKKSRWEY